MLACLAHQRDDLATVRRSTQRIEDARRKTARARPHGIVEQAEHRIQLRGRGRPLEVPHGGDPKRTVADKGDHVGAWPRLVDGIEIGPKVTESEVFGFTQQIDGFGDRWRMVQRRQAHAAIADHHGGNALADLRLHGRGRHTCLIVVCVRVYETRGEALALNIDLFGRTRATQLADRNDPVALDCQVRLVGAAPAAIDERTAREQRVITRQHAG